jgi:hypothetical protein
LVVANALQIQVEGAVSRSAERQLIRTWVPLGTGGAGVKIAGLGFASLVTVVIGLVMVLVGLLLGVLDGLAMGGMVGLLVGIGLIVIGFLFKDEN